ncbi:DUF1120 domain-containing protein [Chromobacterium haemolyticum]|uniref:DUF1120 domain-containing protein n=1 Tax=Chromobacterium haemolyticum TaxID=394935 RepID=UPI00307EA4F1
MLSNSIRAVLAAGVFCAGGVHAAELGSTQFEVKGVIKPTACTVSFSGGGVFDYGVIDKSHLDGTDDYYYVTGPKQDYSIVCEKPAGVSVKFIDNMPEHVHAPDATRFGLVSDYGSPIGFHYFHVASNGLKVLGENGSLVDGAVYGTSSDNSKWDLLGAGYKSVRGGDYYTAIDAGSKDNVPFTRLDSHVASMLAIHKQVSVKDDLEFHGVVTMELHYI